MFWCWFQEGGIGNIALTSKVMVVEKASTWGRRKNLDFDIEKKRMTANIVAYHIQTTT